MHNTHLFSHKYNAGKTWQSRHLYPWLQALFLFLILFLFCGWLADSSAANIPGTPTRVITLQPLAQNDEAFVTRSGSSLLINGHPFRFSGANIYWLGVQQEQGVTYPSYFRIDDALATAEFMGATVVRSHTLGISVGCPVCIEPSLGVFNQTAFQHIDYAIQSAKRHHIRLLIPLVDNWHYYHGGKHTFTDWRGIADENRFYSDPQVINDFKLYINTILNHVNTYTGIAYKDDPTIMAWATGNELFAPASWVATISAYIKGIDHHHLVADGNYVQAGETDNFLPDLNIKTVDMYSGHYYPPSTTAMYIALKAAKEAHKVFFVGEYDWNTDNGDTLQSFLTSIEGSNIAGDLYWSLFPHNDAYGFVSEWEHFTLHYPGTTGDMQDRVQLLRIHAFAMQQRPVPTTLPPGVPVITKVSGSDIYWRGAYGADTYSVERSEKGSAGPWKVICNRCATDNDTPWFDDTQPDGNVWYRIRAYTITGTAGPYSAPYPVSP